MITFKEFALADKDIIVEAKLSTGDLNMHLSHLEDLAVERGKAGFTDFDAQVSNLINYVRNLNSDVKVSDKIDGAPAIYFGVDPRLEYKGQFFVSTKSGFLKKPKICHNEMEIKNFYGATVPGLVPILTSALNNLSKAYDGSGLMYHGDLLFSASDQKQIEIIEGVKYVSFKPNTITYAVPVDDKSELYRRVIAAELGIIVHAGYYAEADSTDQRIIPRDSNQTNFEKLINNGIANNVFVEDSVIHKTIDLDVSIDNIYKIKNMLSKSWGHINNINDRFDEEWKSNQALVLIKKYINSQVRSRTGGIFTALKEGKEFDFDKFVKGFSRYLRAHFADEAEEKKTESGRQSRLAKAEEIIDWLEENSASFEGLMEATYLMMQIKKKFLKIFKEIDGKVGRTYLKNPDGSYRVSQGEGFVVSVGPNQVKLVDRLDFTRQNMRQGSFRK